MVYQYFKCLSWKIASSFTWSVNKQNEKIPMVPNLSSKQAEEIGGPLKFIGPKVVFWGEPFFSPEADS
jgi:hypothetical protein